MSTKQYDLCVIGAGPGGYTAAIRAAQLGLKTALIEKRFLGGTCLNVGCIPTKTLIASADVFHDIRNSEAFGINIKGEVTADWPAMQRRKQEIVSKLVKGIEAILKAAKVDTVTGSASFVDTKTVSVREPGGKYRKVNARKFIIATGSKSAEPGFIPGSKRILTSTELLNIGRIPKRLLILGGGVIGCEFASLFAELGSEVTIIEMMASILPTLDKEISRIQSMSMKRKGIQVLTGHPMENIKASARAVKGVVDSTTVSGDYLLVAVGRSPVTDELNLNAAGVRLDEKGWVPVDSKCRTNVPGIYAIGDVTGTIWQLAHFASAMGICAAENASGSHHSYENSLIPGCIFTRPEISTVGLTTEQCRDKEMDVRIGKFPFAALGKAMAMNETEGLIKIIARRDNDQILGVHIIGPHATDLISEAVTAMRLEITAEELGKVIHPHPTLGEGMMEAAHALHGRAIHVAAKKSRK